MGARAESSRPRPLIRLGGILLLVVGTLATTLVSSDQAGATTPPVVISLSPSNGPLQGTIQLSIQGSGFFCGGSQPSPSTKILFGASEIAYGTTVPTGKRLVQLVTDTQILVDVPSSSTAGPVDVRVSAPCGTSATSPATSFAYQGQCNGTCPVQVAATQETGPVQRYASGILEGVRGGWTSQSAKTRTVNYLNALRPARWRAGFISNTADTTSAVLSQLSPQPAVELELESGWLDATGHLPPWRDDYVTWDRYVRAMVSRQPFCGPHACVPAPPPVAYWDIWNEPITFAVFVPEGTVGQYLNLLQHTYHDIKDVDPHAKVVAPSVTSMLDYLPNAFVGGGPYIDFVTLLSFASQNGLRFDAYSFHDINNGATCSERALNQQAGCPAYPINSPTLITDHVDRLRNLIDQYPNLLPADVEINEFGSPANYNAFPQSGATSLIPGWQAGFIDALEQANARGYLGCWTRQYKYLNLFSRQWSECDKGVDSLMIDDQNFFQPNQAQADEATTPEAIYSVYQFYNGMLGKRVATSSTNTDLTAFATSDARTNTVKALVGRHMRCSIYTGPPRSDPRCPAGGASAVVPIQVSWPHSGTTVNFTLQRIPDAGNGFGAMLGTLPAPTVGHAAVSNGVATVTVPAFTDGEAYTLTMTPE